MKNRTATVELTDCHLLVSAVREGVVVNLINTHPFAIVENWSGGAMSVADGWNVTNVRSVAQRILDRNTAMLPDDNANDVAELSRAIAFVVGV